MAATATKASTARPGIKALFARASFILGSMALIFAFVLSLTSRLSGAEFAMIAIAVAGGQHVVNGVERLSPPK